MSQSYASWVKQLRTKPSSSVFPDSAIRWQPDALNVPESLGYTATTHVAGLSRLGFLQRSLLHGLSIQNQAELVALDLPYLETFSANLILKNNAALASLSAPNLGLPTYGSSVLGASIDLSGCALTSAAVDALLNRLALSVSTSTNYVVINVSGGTNGAPTAASSLATSSLHLGATARHITVTHN